MGLCMFHKFKDILSYTCCSSFLRILLGFKWDMKFYNFLYLLKICVHMCIKDIQRYKIYFEDLQILFYKFIHRFLLSFTCKCFLDKLWRKIWLINKHKYQYRLLDSFWHMFLLSNQHTSWDSKDIKERIRKFDLRRNSLALSDISIHIYLLNYQQKSIQESVNNIVHMFLCSCLHKSQKDILQHNFSYHYLQIMMEQEDKLWHIILLKDQHNSSQILLFNWGKLAHKF